MHPLLRKLEGGDRRSIGRSQEVVEAVFKQPRLFPVVIAGLSVDDAIVRMRAADAMEKISLQHPEYLWPHKRSLIERAAKSDQKEIRWHLAQVLPRLRLKPAERQRVVDILLAFLKDRSSIVKTCAMQALADLASEDPTLRAFVQGQLQSLVATGTPAMKARGRRRLAELKGLEKRSSRGRRA